MRSERELLRPFESLGEARGIIIIEAQGVEIGDDLLAHPLLAQPATIGIGALLVKPGRPMLGHLKLLLRPTLAGTGTALPLAQRICVWLDGAARLALPIQLVRCWRGRNLDP
jgi:hypothetical protein